MHPMTAATRMSLLWAATAHAMTVVPLTDWVGCPHNVSAKEASLPTFDPSMCVPATVPGTILQSMLKNGAFPDVTDPYYGELLKTIPDISETGSAFYTWTYRTRIRPSHVLRHGLHQGASGASDRRRHRRTQNGMPNHSVGGGDDTKTESWNSGTTTWEHFNKRLHPLRAAPPGPNRLWLHLRGVSYTATVYINGMAQQPVEAPAGTTRLQGMFHRWSFDLGTVAAMGVDSDSEYIVAIRVEPPTYPGSSCRPCAHPPCTPCGQGGDHQIARNAGMMQMTQGWDWCQATPDRNTGLWDAVTMALTHDIVMKDPLVATVTLTGVSGEHAKSATLAPRILVQNRATTPVSGTVSFSLTLPSNSNIVNNGDNLTTMNNAVLSVATTVVLQGLETKDVDVGALVVPNATLWWPHTHGRPYLYNASFAFTPRMHDVDTDAPLTHVSVRVGIRTTKAEVDETLGGWLFKVNGHAIYIQGGNWIATDQLQRYSTDAQRYFNEVRMHAEMGLNFIRVWGGGLTERPEFYDAADELGVLVMQEFWMSGDNNGRWAGSFDWPDNHGIYLDNAADAIMMLRRHPSLLLWCGGNELYPVVQQPLDNNGTRVDPGRPAVQMQLLKQLATLVDRLDPGRFFISSSMSNISTYDPLFALAPTDGNYGINPAGEYFRRNPGLFFRNNNSRMTNAKVAFQPEIGSVSSPVVESLRRFMNPDALNAFPRTTPEGRALNPLHPTWEYHNYEGFTPSGLGQDLLSRFGVPTTIEQYSIQAQMAQFFQYQALFEGFRHHAFVYTSGVVFWKSQSPWPALRGAFYDLYLDTTGGYWGVRSACRDALHLQLHQINRSLAVVSRRFEHVNNLMVRMAWYDLATGTSVGRPSERGPLTAHANSVTQVAGGSVPWPTAHEGTTEVPTLTRKEEHKVYLLRLALIDTTRHDDAEEAIVSSNEYWLAPDVDGTPASSAAWSTFRTDVTGTIVNVSVTATGRAINADGDMRVTAQLRHVAVAGTPHPMALMVRAKIVRRKDSIMAAPTRPVDDDTRVLPVWWCDNYISLRPGEARTLTAEFNVPMKREDNHNVRQGLFNLEVDGFNVEPIAVPITMSAQSA
eukprot:m.181113 g.181113  ORF g.181113 m.181113 type:complete len:1092 (+) comp15169_c0_seq1:273-3548(+)